MLICYLVSTLSFLSVYYFTVGRGAKHCDQHVCTSVCLFVCLLVCLSVRFRISKPRVQISWNFCTCFLWPRLDYSQTTSAIRYVLPVLWMTSCFHIIHTYIHTYIHKSFLYSAYKFNRVTMRLVRPTGQNHRRRVFFRRDSQVAAPGEKQLYTVADLSVSVIRLLICSLFTGAQYWCLSWRTTERMLQRSSVHHGFCTTTPVWIQLRQCILLLSLHRQIIPPLYQQA